MLSDYTFREVRFSKNVLEIRSQAIFFFYKNIVNLLETSKTLLIKKISNSMIT